MTTLNRPGRTNPFSKLATLTKLSVRTLMLGIAVTGCGVVEDGEWPADAPPPSAPSLAEGNNEQAPNAETLSPPDDIQPARPSEPIYGDPGAPPPTSALIIDRNGVVQVGGPLTTDLTKGDDSASLQRPRGNQPTAGESPAPQVIVTNPTSGEPEACQQQCPAGTVLDPVDCKCQCPDARAEHECRLEPGQ